MPSLLGITAPSHAGLINAVPPAPAVTAVQSVHMCMVVYHLPLDIPGAHTPAAEGSVCPAALGFAPSPLLGTSGTCALVSTLLTTCSDGVNTVIVRLAGSRGCVCTCVLLLATPINMWNFGARCLELCTLVLATAASASRTLATAAACVPFISTSIAAVPACGCAREPPSPLGHVPLTAEPHHIIYASVTTMLCAPSLSSVHHERRRSCRALRLAGGGDADPPRL